ncbi:hypothetical protein OG455_41290 [Kitasatospora sp. NBC_01287]|uniref:hypothetical protein n=1 Tax=Kitasatospora sp. NBC_01287 TaxID=2903573 RepID=UPI002250F8CD|nr:hypothetical protein [Kitasatospora sp. NBC_01287]MCX4750918.1 hypothetical protein [Kitasatospora sp. NBC_01287]MCX4751831.1 hypothetical protein [Kitasatospora sp. NBC_01287]MCX4751877.1 hypothetical protein [Kitasatospora sp. NBC_01287]
MGQTSPFTPNEISDGNYGVRPSMAGLIELVDTSDPAFPYIAAVLRDMQGGGVELNEATIAIAIQLGRQKQVRSRSMGTQSGHADTVHPTTGAIVYYIRRSEAIKIGTTASPVKRFRSLLPDEIMAFEPGGYALEAERHTQFAHLRIAANQEYFTPASDLLSHISTVRDQHGSPDPAWPTLGWVHPRYAVELPPPATTEMVTAADGCTRLGVKKSTLHGWVHRGRISPVGYNSRGHQLFYIDHLRYLARLNAPWTGWTDDEATLSA